MRDSCSLMKAIVLLVVAGAQALYAQDGLSDAFARLNSAIFPNNFSSTAIATADFNNDEHPDGAVLFRNNNTFEIEVHFRFQRVSRITFASRFRKLAISAFDVNHDGNADLVVEEPFSNRLLFVWLNDGYGSFHPANAEDYSNPFDHTCRNFTDPQGNPQSLALVVSGKSRIREIQAALGWLPPSADRFRPGWQALSPFLTLTSTANLLRGPPTALPV